MKPRPTTLSILAAFVFLSVSSLVAQDHVPIHENDFEAAGALSQWFSTQPDLWQLTDTSSKQGQALHLLGVSKNYHPPFRSPCSITLLKDKVVGDFILTAKVKTLQNSRGHRDMCIFWGWQDPSHFYYVHLGETPDPNSSQIFIVNESPRTPITKTNAGGIPWKDDTWHGVKLVRKVEDGTVEVYFDDMVTPVKNAQDTTFAWGLLGLGSFDDLGMWDDVKINGVAIEGKSPVLPTPNREIAEGNGAVSLKIKSGHEISGVLAKQGKNESIITLADGKTLSGWHADPEDTAASWSVQDGMIVGDNPDQVGSVLWTNTDHGDYELTLEYQTDSPDYDSGVFLRGKSHQVQIGVSRSQKRDLTACIYAPKDDQGKYPAESDQVETVHKLGEWNTLRIVVTGKRIQTFLNGKPFVDYQAVTIPETGQIGLQLHGGVHQRMHFRNIVLKPAFS